MQDHALPQDVTGYKFHIIGNMTLKQFGEVAAGCIVAFVLYQTNLLPIIKIPLMVIAAGAGAMVAFVPIEERPLDLWITAFFSALYRPTQYYWKRMVKIPEPFLYQPKSEMRSMVEDVNLTPARRQRVKDYLRSIDDKPVVLDQFDQYTDQRLGEVMSEFGSQLTPALAFVDGGEQSALLNASPDSVSSTFNGLSFAGRGGVSEEQVVEEGPSAQEVERSNDVLRLFDSGDAPLPVPNTVPQMQSKSVYVPAIEETPIEPPILPTLTETLQISTVFERSSAPIESIPQVQTSSNHSLGSASSSVDSENVATVADNIMLSGKNDVQFKNSRKMKGDSFETVLPHILDMTGSTELVQIEQTPEPGNDKSRTENKEVVVPELEEIRVVQTVKAPEEVSAVVNSDEMSSAVDPSLLQAPDKVENIKTSGAVTFNNDLPFPEKPTKPNKVVGMVIDQTGISQPNAIVEILSADGIPARAVKTNPLGQFFISTPLNPGEYLITAEKDGFTFSTQQLSITDKIIDPIEIRAN